MYGNYKLNSFSVKIKLNGRYVIDNKQYLNSSNIPIM